MGQGGQQCHLAAGRLDEHFGDECGKSAADVHVQQVVNVVRVTIKRRAFTRKSSASSSGRSARYLESVDGAREWIAGHTVANDVPEREFQLELSGGQWSKGKCCESFNPLGPALVPADELNAADLGLRSFVNGEIRQDSSTAELIFGVYCLVGYLTQFAVLEPGDVVNTGTPEGVALSGRFPYLKAGDAVDVEIEGIGRARQVCRDA